MKITDEDWKDIPENVQKKICRICGKGTHWYSVNGKCCTCAIEEANAKARRPVIPKGMGFMFNADKQRYT